METEAAASLMEQVLYEVKNGPYAQETDKAFAPWAPAEGDPGTAEYLETLMSVHRNR